MDVTRVASRAVDPTLSEAADALRVALASNSPLPSVPLDMACRPRLVTPFQRPTYATAQLDIAAQVLVQFPSPSCIDGGRGGAPAAAPAEGQALGQGFEPLLGVMSVQDTRQDGVYEGRPEHSLSFPLRVPASMYPVGEVQPDQLPRTPQDGPGSDQGDLGDGLLTSCRARLSNSSSSSNATASCSYPLGRPGVSDRMFALMLQKITPGTQVMRFTLWVAPLSRPTAWALADEDYIVIIVLNTTDFSVLKAAGSEVDPSLGMTSGQPSSTTASARVDGDNLVASQPGPCTTQHQVEVHDDAASASTGGASTSSAPSPESGMSSPPGVRLGSSEQEHSRCKPGATMLHTHPVLQRYRHLRDHRLGCQQNQQQAAGRASGGPDLASARVANSAQAEPLASGPPTQSSAPSAPSRPRRVSITGDAVTYDGMKANLVQQVRRLRATGHDVAYLNTVCQELDGGTTLREFHNAGAEVYNVCNTFDMFEAGSDRRQAPDIMQRYFTKILPRLKSLDHLASTVHSGYRFLLDQLSRSDALVVGFYFGPDTHIFALGRLVQPGLFTLLDIGSSHAPGRMPSNTSYLPPPPPEADPDMLLMLHNTHLLDRACSSVATCASALKPPSPVPTVKDPPLVDFTDVVVSPSAHIASLPTVVAAGRPSLHLRPTVDMAEFHPHLHPHASSTRGLHRPTSDENQAHSAGPAVPSRVQAEAGVSAPCATIRRGVDIVIGTAGRLAPEKNMGLLVHAYALLREHMLNGAGTQDGQEGGQPRARPRTRLLLVGKSDSPLYWEGLAFMSDALGVPQDEIVGLGFSSPEDIPQYLSCMDVYVCPSVQETYGISVVQAMAMSLPVIHYGIAGIQDFVEDGVNSVQLRDWRPSVLAGAMESLIWDPDSGLVAPATLRRHELGRQARAFATRYLSSLALSSRVPFVFNATRWHRDGTGTA